jgi:hypothetical protein
MMTNDCQNDVSHCILSTSAAKLTPTEMLYFEEKIKLKKITLVWRVRKLTDVVKFFKIEIKVAHDSFICNLPCS